jgi:hypothetical protein
MSERTGNTLRVALAALSFVSFAGLSWAGGNDSNTTGLPTYPHDSDRRMDSVARSLPNGQHCTHYSSQTADELAAVIAWYRKALPAAKVEDVNTDSLYGSYFKMDGVKLLVGNDIVNVYRIASSSVGGILGGKAKAGASKTSIEIFKCKDAPAPKRED